jgi:hypothetical protein
MAWLCTARFSQSSRFELKPCFSPPSPSPDLFQSQVEAAIDHLHDHISYIRQSPIVIACEELDPNSSEAQRLDPVKLAHDFDLDAECGERAAQATSPWHHYAITDELPLPFGLTSHLRYQAAIRNMADGIENFVLAPSGVTISGVVRVEARERDDGRQSLWLMEAVHVSCWRGMGWYIEKTLRESHEMLADHFRNQWEETWKRKLGR